MLFCDLTLDAPAANLALDEVLLDLAEAEGPCGILRFWEPRTHVVVVGYANHVSREVDLECCRRQGIPVLRRCTGGGTVLQGPGCLNYSLVLPIAGAAPLQGISGTNDFVLERHCRALTALLGAKVQQQGHTDLAVGGVKFSGNAQRRRSRCLLFHGSFLLNLDIRLVELTLRFPSKPPEYRANRSHTDFLMNLHVAAAPVKDALREAWGARTQLERVPLERIDALVREKYAREEWIFKF